MPPIPPVTSRRALAWLVAGAVSGMALAAYGLAGTDPRLASVPAGAVATVNGIPIPAADYAQLIDGLETDTRAGATPEMRQRVLDRMIEEELLVQRALSLGLATSDRRVRADLTSSVIRSVVLEAEEEQPDDAELRRFYAEEAAFFTQPGRVKVRQVLVRVPNADAEAAAHARADQVSARLAAGDDYDVVRRELGDEEVSPLPAALLPPAKLREYVGPTALGVVMQLAPGVWSAPVRSGIGYHVFQVVEREEPSVPPFEQMKQTVRNEWVRRSGDRALRRYLDQLRAAADVRVDPKLP